MIADYYTNPVSRVGQSLAADLVGGMEKAGYGMASAGVGAVAGDIVSEMGVENALREYNRINLERLLLKAEAVRLKDPNYSSYEGDPPYTYQLRNREARRRKIEELNKNLEEQFKRLTKTGGFKTLARHDSRIHTEYEKGRYDISSRPSELFDPKNERKLNSPSREAARLKGNLIGGVVGTAVGVAALPVVSTKIMREVCGKNASPALSSAQAADLKGYFSSSVIGGCGFSKDNALTLATERPERLEALCKSSPQIAQLTRDQLKAHIERLSKSKPFEGFSAECDKTPYSGFSFNSGKASHTIVVSGDTATATVKGADGDIEYTVHGTDNTLEKGNVQSKGLFADFSFQSMDVKSFIAYRLNSAAPSEKDARRRYDVADSLYMAQGAAALATAKCGEPGLGKGEKASEASGSK
jgi:hypothetical protein